MGSGSSQGLVEVVANELWTSFHSSKGDSYGAGLENGDVIERHVGLEVTGSRGEHGVAR